MPSTAPSIPINAAASTATHRSQSPGAGGRKKSTAGAQQTKATNPSTTIKMSHPPDVYYGFRTISEMSCRFVVGLYACPLIPPATSNGSNASNTPELTSFIAYAIHRTRLPEAVVYCSLFLLARLKERFPAARGSSGHRLFISAFMIASKVICDDTYSNKSWCIVAQNLYSLKEINQMEREMCSYLEWILHVDHHELEVFTNTVKHMYGADQSQPVAWPGLRQILPTPAPKVVHEDGPQIPLVPTPSVTTASLPATHPAPVADAVAAPIVSAAPVAVAAAAVVVAKNAYPSPSSSHGTPSPTQSQSASPASSASCITPPNGQDETVSISGATGAPTPNNASVHAKKTGQEPEDQSFAFAGPTVW